MGNVVNLRILAKHLLVADGKDSVSLHQQGKVSQPIFISVVTDEVFLCKSILHVCKANLLLIHHKWSPPILESVPSQGKANKPYISGNRQEFFLKLMTLHLRGRWHA